MVAGEAEVEPRRWWWLSPVVVVVVWRGAGRERAMWCCCSGGQARGGLGREQRGSKRKDRGRWEGGCGAVGLVARMAMGSSGGDDVVAGGRWLRWRAVAATGWLMGPSREKETEGGRRRARAAERW